MNFNGKNKEYTAVLLAAGYGSRIASLTDKPKCLLSLGKKTLLERHLDTWKDLGIQNVHIVLGYKASSIEPIANKYTQHFQITYLVNEDFRNCGNTFSLYLGIKGVQGPCLIFDADLAYDPIILDDFLKNGPNSEMAVAPVSMDNMEATKALVDEKKHIRVLADKRPIQESELLKYRFMGEAIGILKFSSNGTSNLKKHAKSFLSIPKNLNLNWEYLMNEYLLSNDVGAHMTQEGNCIEIDTPEDFKMAKSLFGYN